MTSAHPAPGPRTDDRGRMRLYSDRVATLRLFAQAREAAGSGTLEIDAPTVRSVLDAASARLGDDFDAVLASSRVWLNGTPADLDDEVGHDDEVAILPPVSGG